MKEEQKKIEKKEEEKTLICPFNPNLSCKNCRLNQPYFGGRGDKVCIFLRMNENRGV